MSQDNLASQIGMFHTIFIVCLTIFIVALLITIFLFIRLNIPGVIGFLTGHSQRRTVEKMMEGESSGNLSYSGKKKKKKKQHKKNSSKNPSKKEVADSIMTPSGQLKMPGSDQVMLSTGSDITDLLGENAKTEERMVDESAAGIQANSPANASDDALASRRMTRPMGRFVIEKSIVLIHTDEVIR